MSSINAFAPARDIAKLIQEREWSSREGVKDYLAQIRCLNLDMNAIVSLDKEKGLGDPK